RSDMDRDAGADDEAGSDRFVETERQDFYAPVMGHPSLPPPEPEKEARVTPLECHTCNNQVFRVGESVLFLETTPTHLTCAFPPTPPPDPAVSYQIATRPSAVPTSTSITLRATRSTIRQERGEHDGHVVQIAPLGAGNSSRWPPCGTARSPACTRSPG